MSTDDPYCTPNTNWYSGRVRNPLITVGICLLALLVGFFLPLLVIMLLFMLFCSSIDSGNIDGPAPDANFVIRRQWGEENLHHHFKAADQWIRTSTQIAKDVGSIKGVAPVGSPNSLRVGFGESSAAMNLQVVGDNGEGVLHLPDFCADDSKHILGFDNGSWIFENRRHPVLPSGKSWLEKYGVDSLYDQVFEFAAQEDHDSVVKTCLQMAKILKACEAKGTLTGGDNINMFTGMDAPYRYKLVKQYTESLSQLYK